MKILKFRSWGVVGLILVSLAMYSPVAWGATEEQKFDMLQIGTRTYRNVTVTTKTKDYVFLLHSDGMANIKVSELPSEVRHQLGYVDPEPPKSVSTKANEWAKQSLDKIETPQVKVFESQVQDAWATKTFQGITFWPLPPKILWPATGGVVAFYLFFCYCCQSLCQKTGKKPGALVWFPILKVFPLLTAASMSPWWLLAFPLAPLVWCFKIAKARGKNAAFGILLLLPIINVIPFLYLAFANGAAPAKQKRRVEIMTLEAV